ncbi:MAG: hydroxyacylglutathione hydrolase [Arenimonas sp.]
MVGFCGKPPFRSPHCVHQLRPLPAFEDNYIWTLANDHDQAVVVDPGDAAPVLAAIEAGLRPVALLLTHHHADHVGGAAGILDRFDIPCFAPHDERIVRASRRVRDGDRVEIPELGLAFDVLEIPGHTRSHIAFHGGGVLFCGDTLFSMGCGRMFEGTPAQMLRSLDRLAALPGDTQVCCGHEYTVANGRFAQAAEPANAARDRRQEEARAQRAAGLPTLPSTLAGERECNPFLRVDVPGLRANLEARAGGPLDREAAFAALRAWKDEFRG